eukprot:301473-Heterocapsa_arctica.AAC.1
MAPESTTWARVCRDKMSYAASRSPLIAVLARARRAIITAQVHTTKTSREVTYLTSYYNDLTHPPLGRSRRPE